MTHNQANNRKTNDRMVSQFINHYSHRHSQVTGALYTLQTEPVVTGRTTKKTARRTARILISKLSLNCFSHRAKTLRVRAV